MPWHIGSSDTCPAGKPHAVIKDGTDEVEGCHPTQEAARLQMAALYASEAPQPAKATLLDDDAFRLLAIPFGGPIPHPSAPRGRDLDGEWFSERTDIRPQWLKARAVDWHHGADQVMGREVIGKAVDPTMEEDGWWVTIWLDHGARRLQLIKRLAEKGAAIFGSSESVAGLVKKASTGEILEWPYWRQTLSTSPQNTHSIIAPIKAVLDQTDLRDTTSAFWRDLGPQLQLLAADLRTTYPMGGDGVAMEQQIKAMVDRLTEATDKAIQVARTTSDTHQR